jgi:hypothetical protein
LAYHLVSQQRSAGIFTPAASGNGCSFVGGVYYFTLAGTLVQGGATLQITINAVTI